MSTGPTVQVNQTYATVDITAGGATVTVDVPETTVSITAPGPQGPAGTGATGYILQAYDTTDQTAANTTTAYPLKLGIVDISDGITVANNGSGNPTRITFTNDGDYNIQFSIQFQNSSASEAEVNVWFRKNDIDIADSNSQATIPKKHGSNNGSLILALNLVVAAAATDYVEIMWQTESTDVSIQALPAGTTPTTPVTPSVIVTVMVNRYLELGPAGPGVATGGTTGQYLTKSSNTNYATTWTTLPNDLPTGGSTGQALTKTSASDYATTWTTIPNDLPSGGDAGELLVKATGTNYDTAWVKGGLRLIKEVNIGTGVATVSVTDVFSSTYNNYRVFINDPVGSITYVTELRIQFDGSTTGYYGGFTNIYYGSSLLQVSLSTSAVTYCPIGYAFNSTGSQLSFDISSPNAARSTSWSGTLNCDARFGFLGGNQRGTTQWTGFNILTASGTITGGTIRVYGYIQ